MRLKFMRPRSNGIITDPIRIDPVTIVKIFGEIACRLKSASKLPKSTAAAATPQIVPTPPKILTPPSRTVAITESSKPIALSY